MSHLRCGFLTQRTIARAAALGCLVRITSASSESPPQLPRKTWLSILLCFFSGLLACCYGFRLAGGDGSISSSGGNLPEQDEEKPSDQNEQRKNAQQS
ncbi:hypothetical protein ACFOZ5_03550 [Marinobacter lacisalsi]|uniref:Lipoprotein n=1 Tax=Marinobacter lacisalsi TaxID=475979 RepID=A0ABV8QGA7_9GAMM